MGARPSQFKKGGGFLNNVDGVITGYTFTDEFNGEPFRPGKDPKTKKDKFHSLNTLLAVRVDGADEDVTTTLFTGGWDDFNVSEDGLTIWDSQYETEEEAIAAGTEARQIGANTALAKFINSLVKPVDDLDNGFPEDKLPEDSINFEPIIGTRVRFVQRDNAEDTKKLGKRKGANGKEYSRQDLLVSTVYSLPGAEQEAAPATKAAKGGKVVKGTKPAVAVKVAAKAKGNGHVDIPELSQTTLQAILAESGGTTTKTKLGMKVLQKLMKRPDDREEVRNWLFDDKNLSGIEGVTYNKAKGTITLDEVEAE